MNRVRRRLMGCATGLLLVARPLLAQAPGRLYRLGLFGNITQLPRERFVRRIEEILGQHGFVAGRNLRVDFVRPEGPDYTKSARELVAMNPDVIYVGTTFMTKAVQAQTNRIPIVFTVGGDPVTSGLVRNLARPGGNLTGVTQMAIDLTEKWLQLVRELLPGARRVGWISDFPRITAAWGEFPKAIDASARKLGLEIIRGDTALHDNDPEAALLSLLAARPDAVIPLGPYPGYAGDFAEVMRRFELTHRIPIIHNEPGQGVIALGPDQLAEMGRAMAIVARILKGAKPGDIPVDRVTVFRMTVNLSIAKAIGLEVPASILIRADEVMR